MRRIVRWLLILMPLVLLTAVSGFVIWANATPAPMAEAEAAMQGSARMEVIKDTWIAFQPTDAEINTGFIFYPGGRVAPEAYAPVLEAIAAQGYLAVNVPMPLNLAVFGAERAKDVIAAYPEIDHWVVGGHSLGGSMAARFAYDHPDLVDGLALWASYPEDSKDLSQSDIAAVSVYGTLDGLATIDKIENTRHLLPEDTAMVAIEGGNHAQFGWYGEQAGDNPAAISHEQQMTQIVESTLAVLDEVSAQVVRH